MNTTVTVTTASAPRGPWRAALAVAVALSALSGLGVGDALERRAVDALEERAGGAPSSARLVICAITPSTLKRVGTWPFPRATHARLIERLTAAHVRGVVLDVITEYASPRGPADDAALEQAVRAAGNVAVPITLASNNGPKFGLPGLRAAAFAVGHVHFPPDDDQTLRAYEARLRVDDAIYPAMPIAAAALARSQKVGEVASARMPIEFTRVPGAGFPVKDYADVLDGKVPDMELAGRLVFVGSTEQSVLKDEHKTPVGAMNGIEVLATATATLLAPLPRVALGAGAVAVLLALVALAAAALVGRPRVVPWRGTTRGARGTTGGSRGATGSRGPLANPRSRSGPVNPGSRPGPANPASRPPPANPSSKPGPANPSSKPGPANPSSRPGPANPGSKPGARADTAGPGTAGIAQRPRRMVLAPPPPLSIVVFRGAAFVAALGAALAGLGVSGVAHPPVVAPLATACAAYVAALFSNALARRNAADANDAAALEMAGPREPLITLARRALGPDYEDLELLGTGGSGFVVRAHWLSQDLAVAVKFLAPALCALPEARDRFRRESTLLASLKHPGLIGVYAMSDGALPFFAMELMEGGHLGQVMEQNGDRLSEADTGRLLAPIANALSYLHARGVAHRDVKPANILVDAWGGTRLTDFSVAGSRELPGLTRPGQQLGTPVFMAPEALRGDVAADARPGDIYALCVVIYLCLTGRLPFAENMHPAARLLVEPAPIAVEGLDPRLAALVMQGLARDPAKRPPDAAELEDALVAVAGPAEPFAE